MTGVNASNRPDKSGNPWGFWATTGLGIAAVASGVILQAVGLALIMGPTQSIAVYLLMSMLTFAGGVTLLVLLSVALRKGPSVRSYLAVHWPGAGSVLAWLAVMGAVVGVLNGIALLLGREAGADPTNSLDTVALLFYGFAMVFAAPISEEALFRGFLFAGWSRTRFGVTGTILLTSALWAAMHVQYSAYGIAEIFVHGLALGIARHRSGSLVVPLLMHAAVNLAGYLRIAYLLQS